MYYTTYETIDFIYTKYYIGKHQTGKLEDEYLGSGRLLNERIKIDGKRGLQKVINGVWRSEEIMNLMESWLVDKDIIDDPSYYNIAYGGKGGWSYINEKGLTNRANPGPKNGRYGKKLSKKEIQKIRGGMNKIEENGKTIAQNASQRAAETIRKNGKRKGKNNPAANRILIYDNHYRLQYLCYGNFRSTCREHNLPFTAFQNSYLEFEKTNTITPLYKNVPEANGKNGNSKSKLINKGFWQYRGWFAIKLK